jgi:hypothetical protein
MENMPITGFSAKVVFFYVWHQLNLFSIVSLWFEVYGKTVSGLKFKVYGSSGDIYRVIIILLNYQGAGVY